MGSRPARRQAGERAEDDKRSASPMQDDESEKSMEEPDSGDAEAAQVQRPAAPCKSVPAASPSAPAVGADSGHVKPADQAQNAVQARQTAISSYEAQLGLGSYLLAMLNRQPQKSPLPAAERKPPFRRACTHIAIAYYLQFKHWPRVSAALRAPSRRTRRPSLRSLRRTTCLQSSQRGRRAGRTG